MERLWTPPEIPLRPWLHPDGPREFAKRRKLDVVASKYHVFEDWALCVGVDGLADTVAANMNAYFKRPGYFNVGRWNISELDPTYQGALIFGIKYTEEITDVSKYMSRNPDDYLEAFVGGVNSYLYGLYSTLGVTAGVKLAGGPDRPPRIPEV